MVNVGVFDLVDDLLRVRVRPVDVEPAVAAYPALSTSGRRTYRSSIPLHTSLAYYKHASLLCEIKDIPRARCTAAGTNALGKGVDLGGRAHPVMLKPLVAPGCRNLASF